VYTINRRFECKQSTTVGSASSYKRAQEEKSHLRRRCMALAKMIILLLVPALETTI